VYVDLAGEPRLGFLPASTRDPEARRDPTDRLALALIVPVALARRGTLAVRCRAWCSSSS
jgi:hypothetical protein